MNLKIYQLFNNKEIYLFEPYERIKDKFDINNYQVVYKDEYHIGLKNVSIPYILDDIYRIFNMSKPKNFKGHSLSVSDIIELNGMKYYVDSYGFVKLS